MPSPPLRVLVVDDCPDTADSFALLLELWGHDARAATSGPAALALADSFRPHAALIDLTMPRMDGLEVARRLRARPGGEGLFLLAVSGVAGEQDRRAAAAAGFDAFLAKPCDPPEIERLLADFAAR